MTTRGRVIGLEAGLSVLKFAQAGFDLTGDTHAHLIVTRKIRETERELLRRRLADRHSHDSAGDAT